MEPPTASPGGRARWTINGDFLALAPYGVARYALELTSALDALVTAGHPLARRVDLDLVAPRPAPDWLDLKGIPVRVVPEFGRPRLPQVWVQVQLPRHVPGGLVSFCNLAPVAVRRQIVCIHDLQTRTMPDSYGAGFRLAHRLILPLLGRRVRRVTTVSRESLEHLVGYGVAPREKISVTHNGSDHVRRWDGARSSLPLPEDGPYVFALGRRQPHKNLDLILDLAPLLDAVGIAVLIAGEVDAAFIARHGRPVPPNVHLVGRIGDDDVRRALEHALAFLLPSRSEGFGIPAVEAMACGCPVVASTSPCLPEICGEAAVYADPDDPAAWRDAVVWLRASERERHRLVQAGHQAAASYSWSRIAEQYLALMTAVDDEETVGC
nr:glycosyltransferase family 1 protein [Chthonobacter rhizosphaerae]